MSTTETGIGPVLRTPAQARVLAAAVAMFDRRGVSGTSLQMIADAMGVTKAAVYHQFRTKEQIVIAVLEDDLVHLESALDAAEAEADESRAREVLLAQVIDAVVQRRRIVGALQQDPVIVRLLAQHEPFLALMSRLFTVLTAGDESPPSRVRGAMAAAAIGGAVTHPLVVGLDDDALRIEMGRVARRIFSVD